MSFWLGLLYVLGAGAVTILLIFLVLLYERRKIGKDIDDERNSD